MTAVDFDPNTNKLYTVKQLANMFEVTEWTIRQWARVGRHGVFLKAVKTPSGRLYFTDQAIMEFVNAEGDA